MGFFDPAPTGQPAPTQTTQQVLSPEQRRIMDLAMPGIESFAGQTLRPYQGQTIAGFDPSQTAAQTGLLGTAPKQADVVGSAADASKFYTSGAIWNPQNNPWLGGAIEAGTRPIMENLTRSVLPNLRSEEIKSGPFGSSRGGIAAGMAGQGALQAVGDVGAKMSADLYKTNVDAQLKAMGMAPQTATALNIPSLTTGAVGDVRQAMTQRELDAAKAKDDFEQYANFMRSKELMGLAAGLPGSSVVSTGSVPMGPSTGQKMLSGAAMGASLGSAFGPVGMGVGALGGAALPFAFG